MKFMAEYNMKLLLPSGYRSIIGKGCIGCGECTKYCQFNAMLMTSFLDNGKEKKRCDVISERCFGCGICESKCKKGAISLVLDPEKGIPLNIEILAQSSAP
jgi:ferredoxin